MKFFNKALYFSVAALAAASFSSCDNIDENDRFIPVERPTVEKVILVPEFTGIRCVNCPEGAKTLHDLQGSYPDNVIVVGMQPENTAYTRPIRGFQLYSSEATTYYEYFNPNAFPCAVIDFVSMNYNISQWTTDGIARMSVPSPLTLETSAEYDASTREVKVNYKGTFNQMYNKELSVLVWVIENKIIGPQMTTGGQTIEDYEHNHVLRASANGDWGESLGAYFETEQTVEGTASIVLDEKWVAENCQVVAFFFQTGGKTVEQAAIADVISSQESE